MPGFVGSLFINFRLAVERRYDPSHANFDTFAMFDCVLLKFQTQDVGLIISVRMSAFSSFKCGQGTKSVRMI